MTEQLPPLISPPRSGKRLERNLSRSERSVSVAAGTLLALNGVRQGGLLGLAQLMVGAATAWRGYFGVCQVKHRLRGPTAAQRRDASKVITRSITLDKPRQEVFEFCRNPLNIGALIPWIDAIEEVGVDTYEWRAQGTSERPLHCTLLHSASEDAQRLRWSTAWNGPWDHDIIADFSDISDGRGTQLKVIVACRSRTGQALAMLLGKFADKALLNLLRSIKAQMEMGEVGPHTLGGTPVRDFLFVHPARAERS